MLFNIIKEQRTRKVATSNQYPETCVNRSSH